VVKALTTSVAAAAVRIPARTAVATGLLLAQIGEFSFVLLTVGTAAVLAPLGRGADGSQVVVATTVLMLASPLLTAAATRVERPGRGTSRGAIPAGGSSPAGPAGSADVEDGAGGHAGPFRDYVAIIGWGPTALDIADTLRQRDVPVVMTTLSPDGAAEADAAGHHVVRGDPTKVAVLRAAGLPAARLIVVAEDEPEQAVRVIGAARAVATAPILTRPLGEVDVAEFATAGADHVVDPRRVSGQALLRSVLAKLGHTERTSDRRRAVVDTARVIRYTWPDTDECSHADASRPVVPQAPGCLACLQAAEEWVYLRLCLSWGYVGCCDSSPNRHARAHAHTAGPR
jgi:monovalent cation:H+ antiporter-2, CPA2 family